MYGYFYIKVYKNPNIKKLSYCYMVELSIKYFRDNYKLDKIFYDYKDKPSNHVFKNYLDMLLTYVKLNDIIVIRSLFQLGNTRMDIYKTLSRMRAKQVKLFVDKWQVDISTTMKKVIELSDNDLAIHEELQLDKYNCWPDSHTVWYGKISGYILDDEYIHNNFMIRRKKRMV